MSAVAGILDLPFDSQVLDTMLTTMMHRGPDGTGSYMERRCCLLHSRLKATTNDGNQCISLDWSGEEYVITYNGELYNASELRSRLYALGHIFAGDNDAEVVIHAYAQWKEQCMEKFNGVFAFGVWEKKSKRLFLARDRMGIKPLFYTLHGRGMLFASEIKTLLAYPGIPRELDKEGASQILLLGPGRIPGSGVFKNILELRPGYCGYYSQGQWRMWRYWKLQDREHGDSFEETAECVRYLVTDAISRQIPKDATYGTFLSGGLDSSLVSAICAENNGGIPLRTFSLDYVNNDKYFVPGKFQPNSDNSYIEIMQHQLDSDHNWTVLAPENLINELENATIARDLPGMADVDFSLLAFCRKVRSSVEIVLSGECADEIFGGYPWYRDPKISAYNGFPWAQNTVQRMGFLNPDILAVISPEEFVNTQYLQTINDCDILNDTPLQERRMKELINLNLYWFMQTLLERKDRMCMACGLTARVPFCDYRIVEYMYGVPWAFKDYKNTEKGLLRYAMEGILPEEVLWRKKSPYPKTHDPAYLECVSLKMRQLLEKTDAPIYGIVNKEALQQLLQGDFDKPWYGQLMKQPQTIAYMLQINFWLEHYKIHIC